MKVIAHTSQLASQLFASQTLHSQYSLLHHLASPSTHLESVNMQKALLLLMYSCMDDTRMLEGISFRHSFEVACLLAARFKSVPQAIISALLHEVTVREKVSLAIIQSEFGNDISTIVAGVTQLVEATYLGKTYLLTRLKEILSSPTSRHIHILLVSIVDFLENLYRLEGLPHNKQQQWADLAQHVYAPLAGRLGMHYIQAELEDLHLKFYSKTIYDKIVRHIQVNRSTTEEFLSSFIAPIHLALRRLGVMHTIQARTKSIASIYRKMSENRASLADMHDLYAIRIVFDSRLQSEYATCWLISKVVSKLYATLPNKFRDWLNYPKASGYEALHLTVMTQIDQMVEVQIRSRRMDAIAEKGDAAHWKYKGLAIAQEFTTIDELWIRRAGKFLRIPSTDQPIHIAMSSLYVKQ